MLNLFMAFFCSALISTAMRTSENYIKNNIGLLAVNYMTCTALGLYFSGSMEILPVSTAGFGTALGLGAIAGVFYLVTFLLFQKNLSVNGVVLPATFMKLGILVPTVMSIVAFGENPTLMQIAGILLALCAILLINFEGGVAKAGKSLLLIPLLLLGGLGDGMSKVYEEVGVPALQDHFLFYLYLTALALCLILLLVKKQRIGLHELGFGLLVGVPNYMSSRFLLLALNEVPAVVVYPTFSVGAIVLVSLSGLLVFKEKLSRRRALAIGIILVALVLLNV